jgi:hypothetical protein
MIRDDVVKKAMVLVNIIYKEFRSFFTYERLITWHKMGHLGYSVNHHKDLIKNLGIWKICDEIYRY